MSSHQAACLLAPPIVDRLMDATRDVFGTMVRTELAAGVPIDDVTARPPASSVVGTVSFTGPDRGVVAFYSTLRTAQTIANRLLGERVDTVIDIADAVGEVTNMIAGSFRNHMAADGAAWTISIPTVIVGSDLYATYLSSGRRILCPFRMADDDIFVELIMIQGEDHACTH